MQRIIYGFILCAALVAQQPTTDALARALELADHYNWADAGEWFEKAKAEAGTDARKAMFAEIGIVRSTMEQRVLPEIAAWLGRLVRESPLLASDEELRYFALTVKADIDFELDVRPARLDWDEACAIAQRRQDTKGMIRCQGEQGFIAFVEGDVTRSVQNVLTALQRATAANDVGARIRYMVGIGTGLSMMKSHQAGLDRINDALAVEAANQPLAGYSFPAREGKIMALIGLARKDEAYALGAELLREARRRAKRVKECQLLLILGRHYRDEGNREQAIALFSQAKVLAETGQFTRFLADALHGLAVLRAESGDRTRAVELAAMAAKTTQQSGDLYLLPSRVLNLGKLQATLGRTDEARSTFAVGEAAGELMIGWATATNARIGLVNTLSDLYQEHFLSHARAGDASGAFNVLETIRARTIREIMKGPGNPPDTQAVAELRARIARLGELPELRSVQRDVALREQQDWTNIQKRAASPIVLNDLQQALPADTVLLEYSLAQEPYCIAITNKTARVVKLPGSSKDISATLEKLAAVLKGKQEAGTAGRDAFGALLAPVTELSIHRRVLVARDGPLHLVPVESFINTDGRYVVLTHEVSYIPSATTYMLLRTNSERKTLAGFLGVGGIPYDSSGKNIARTRGYLKNLGNLPGSADEIKNAATVLGRPNTKLLVGAEATESAFKGIAPEHQIIHLAVHGWANTVYPERAALALLPSPEKRDDGLLESWEIANLRLGADLVLLSACDTAVGMVIGEDGVANLSRAFLAAGSRAVLSTLWAADDSAAASLVKRFYDRVKLRAQVGTALTGAKRDLITTFKLAPFYWAPYIVEGDPGFRLQ